MTSFEEGYAAFLKGISRDANPFDKEKSPASMKRWDAGWCKAKGDRKLS